jgi:putative zinc finger/helix-turn-helix YgiT family protein
MTPNPKSTSVQDTELPEEAPDGEPCPNCGKSHIVEAFRPYRATVKTRNVEFTDTISKCKDCGEEFYTFEQAMAHSLALTEALREQEHFPTGPKVKEIRSRLGMSQELFEQALGVGKNTIGRWERGTVPPASAARGLLWFAEHYPTQFLEYARTRGVGASPVMLRAEVIDSALTASSSEMASTFSEGTFRKTSTGNTLALARSTTSNQADDVSTDKEINQR